MFNHSWSAASWSSRTPVAPELGDRKYYDAETGAGCGLDPFWGWSLLAHFMPYEEASEADITEI